MRPNGGNRGGDDGRTAEDRALDMFAELMIDHIKNVQSNWQKPWFSSGSMKWPTNMQNRQYNGGNALMLMMLCQKEGYKTPVFGTFQGITGLNFKQDKDGKLKPAVDANGEKLPLVTINKGAKSFPVQLTTYTVVDKDTKEKIPYEDYKNLSSEEKQEYNVYPRTQIFLVFNVCDQTNLREARPKLYEKYVKENEVKKPEIAEGERYSFAPLDAMIQHDGWVCSIRETDGDSCYYSPSRDEIVMVRRENFRDGESFVSNTFHEMSHSLGADGRLNRIKEGSHFGSDAYSKEELTAELTAALVSSRYGLDKFIKEDSAPYLKSWLDSLHESPEFIKTVLGDVKKCASVMTQHIDAIQERIDQGLDNPIPEKPIFEKKETVQEQNPEQTAREAVAAKYAKMAEKHTPVYQMLNGDILYAEYNQADDMINVGPKNNGEINVRHQFPFDHTKGVAANLLEVMARVEEMPQYSKEVEQEETQNRGLHR